MDTQKRIADYVSALDGITHLDWIKVQAVIAEMFREKKSEYERNLKLASKESAERIIRSLFG